MTAEDLEAGKEFGRYLDVDGDGIPYRTYPGTHPTRGAFFTRGTTQGPLRPLQRGRPRLRRQHAAPAAQVRDREDAGAGAGAARGAKQTPKFGALYFGSTAPAMTRGARRAGSAGHPSRHDAHARLSRSHDDVLDFIAAHDQVFVVEQNRDAQLRTLLVNEGKSTPARLVPILHYDGTPITARFIITAIADKHRARCNVTPLTRSGSGLP